jgi:hypothetical protein
MLILADQRCLLYHFLYVIGLRLLLQNLHYLFVSLIQQSPLLLYFAILMMGEVEHLCVPDFELFLHFLLLQFISFLAD